MSRIDVRVLEPEFQERLRSIARGQAKFGHEAADVLSYMLLALIERGRRDEWFAEQSFGYLVKYAKWQARHYSEKVTTYERYVDSELLARLAPTDAWEMGDALTYAEFLPSDDFSPEALIVQREDLQALADKLNGLTGKQRAVAFGYMRGLATSEVAAQLEMSESSVSHLRARVCEALAERQ